MKQRVNAGIVLLFTAAVFIFLLKGRNNEQATPLKESEIEITGSPSATPVAHSGNEASVAPSASAKASAVTVDIDDNASKGESTFSELNKIATDTLKNTAKVVVTPQASTIPQANQSGSEAADVHSPDDDSDVDDAPERKTYTVTFLNYDGTVLKTETVMFGENAEPPDAPEKPGASFVGWNGNYFQISKDLSVSAVFSDEENIFTLTSATGSKGDTVAVLLDISGTVKTCGFDLTITYDSNLLLTAFDDDMDLDIVSNSIPEENSIRLNYSTASDKTKQRDIIMLHFLISEDSKPTMPITISVNSIKTIANNEPVNARFSSVNGTVILVEKG